MIGINDGYVSVALFERLMSMARRLKIFGELQSIGFPLLMNNGEQIQTDWVFGFFGWVVIVGESGRYASYSFFVDDKGSAKSSKVDDGASRP